MRARVVIVEDGRLALIRRERRGAVYHLFPGGGVEPGETAEEAARREAWEELGVEVELGRVLHEEEFGGERFVYFDARITGGAFGTGTWPDHAEPGATEGTHEAVWLPLAELARARIGLDVRPDALVRSLLAAAGGVE